MVYDWVSFKHDSHRWRIQYNRFHLLSREDLFLFDSYREFRIYSSIPPIESVDSTELEVLGFVNVECCNVTRKIFINN